MTITNFILFAVMGVIQCALWAVIVVLAAQVGASALTITLLVLLIVGNGAALWALTGMKVTS